ncbi:MAG: peptidoglycan-binding protein [Bryobacteraceae bacterium]
MVKSLQQDLRRLGYLATGIDGVFGRATEEAVKALRYDLVAGPADGNDGAAPVKVRDYNKSRVKTVDGVLDRGLAEAMAEMLADERFAKVPSSEDPVAENARAVKDLESAAAGQVPLPFLIAIFKQESGLKHFREPSPRNDDNFVVVGLDRGAAGTPAITSRGYGIGQYTLFHHPPTPEEMRDFILDPGANAGKAVTQLRHKFLRFVNGNTPGTRADDRQAEHGRGALRWCKYPLSDPRYLTGCRECAAQAGTIDIKAGQTRFYAGSSRVYEPSAHHPATEYRGVPVRANIGCDWPYAVRRYNGGGLDSYHYQAQVLLRVRNG